MFPLLLLKELRPLLVLVVPPEAVLLPLLLLLLLRGEVTAGGSRLDGRRRVTGEGGRTLDTDDDEEVKDDLLGPGLARPLV
jgi:hypothetical protein